MTAVEPGRRNLIHLATGVAAPWVLLTPPPWPLVGVGLALAAAASLDLARLSAGPRRRLDEAMPGVYRREETGSVSGATLLAAGYLAATLAFPAPAAAGGIAALAVGDPAAALAGRWWGHRRGSTGTTRKTWVGSVACFITAVPAIWFVAGAALAPAVAGAAFGALVERRAGRWDNLLLPVGVAMLLNLWPAAG